MRIIRLGPRSTSRRTRAARRPADDSSQYQTKSPERRPSPWRRSWSFEKRAKRSAARNSPAAFEVRAAPFALLWKRRYAILFDELEPKNETYNPRISRC